MPHELPGAREGGLRWWWERRPHHIYLVRTREEEGPLHVPPTVLPYLAYELRGFDIDVDVSDLEKHLSGGGQRVARQLLGYLKNLRSGWSLDAEKRAVKERRDEEIIRAFTEDPGPTIKVAKLRFWAGEHRRVRLRDVAMVRGTRRHDALASRHCAALPAGPRGGSRQRDPEWGRLGGPPLVTGPAGWVLAVGASVPGRTDLWRPVHPPETACGVADVPADLAPRRKVCWTDGPLPIAALPWLPAPPIYDVRAREEGSPSTPGRTTPSVDSWWSARIP
ncbi:MAG: hypothetical protein ACLPZM_00570 [Thermoplasmata archaeon]